MKSYKIMIERGNGFVQQSYSSTKRFAISEAKSLNKLGYQVRVVQESKIIFEIN